MSIENQNDSHSESRIAEKGRGNVDWQEFWKNEGLTSPKRNEVFPNGEDKGLSDEEVVDKLNEYFDKKGVALFNMTGIDSSEFPEIIDKDIRQLCVNLNKLSFLKTKEGCGGHETKKDAEGNEKTWDAGYSDAYLSVYVESGNPEFQRWAKIVGNKMEELKKSDLPGVENMRVYSSQNPSKSTEKISSYKGGILINPTKEWCEKNGYGYVKRPDDIGWFGDRPKETEEEWEERKEKYWAEEDLFHKTYSKYFRSEEVRKLRDEFFKVFEDATKEYLKSKEEILSPENKWNAIAQEIEKTADARGYGIDKNIKDTVIALNAHGINTVASCEGHMEKNNYSAPWVEIAAPGEPEERFNSQNEAFEKVAEKYKLPVEEIKRMIPENAYWEAMHKCENNGETKEFVNWAEGSKKIMKAMQEILADFYKNRKVSEDVEIRIEDNTELGNFRIYSGGQDYKIIEKDSKDEDKKGLESKIELYRNEMDFFSKFLKEKFFSEGESYVNGVMKKIQDEIDQEKIQKIKEKL